MIDAKDMARKATSGCGHNQPIIVPCASCVEASMRQWEDAVRHDAKQTMRDEWSRMEVSVRVAEKRVNAAEATTERLKTAIASLERANETYRMQLKSAKAESDELRVSLNAEQSFRLRPSIPMVQD